MKTDRTGNRRCTIDKNSFIRRSQGLMACCLLAAAFISASCNSGYTPRPRGYFKIDLPEKHYQLFDQQNYPYTFEYPVYGNIIKDSLFFDQHPENPYWINIDFPRFNGRI